MEIKFRQVSVNPRLFRRRAALCIIASLLMLPSARAQDYPSKPVRLVTAAVGGGHDLAARLIAQGLTAHLGKQFIVDNRAGAMVAGQYVAKAPADGYTLLVFGTSLWLMPYMRSYVPYDMLRDFAPIGLEVNSPILVVVHPALPVKSVKQLIALARKKPGALDYATGQAGASTYLASELFKSMAGIDMQRVPYKGNGPAMNGLMAGEVQLMFPTAGAAAPQLKSGRLRALAIASAKPSALFPDLATVAAAGLPGYECDSPIGAFAPAKTAPAIVNFLSKEMATAVNRPEVRQGFAAAGVETIGSSPQVLGDVVKSEMTRLGKLLKDLGVRED